MIEAVRILVQEVCSQNNNGDGDGGEGDEDQMRSGTLVSSVSHSKHVTRTNTVSNYSIKCRNVNKCMTLSLYNTNLFCSFTIFTMPLKGLRYNLQLTKIHAKLLNVSENIAHNWKFASQTI